MAIHRNHKSKKEPNYPGKVVDICGLIPNGTYDFNFDLLRKKAVIVSHHKYGPAKDNFASGRVDAILSLYVKLKAYERTGNRELLVDVANYAMFEFMYPLHPNAHYKPMDNDNTTKPVGTPVNMEKD